MKSIRLNVGLRKCLTYLATQCSSRIEDPRSRFTEVCNNILDLYKSCFYKYVPASDVDILKKYHLINNSGSVPIKGDRFSFNLVAFPYYRDEDYYTDDVDFHLNIFQGKFLNIDQSYWTLTVNKDEYNTFEKLMKERNTLKLEYDNAYKNIYWDYDAVIRTCFSTKRLFEYWPKGEAHLPFIQHLKEKHFTKNKETEK